MDIAIARRHWGSARLLFEAMRSKAEVSEDEQDTIQHLQLLFDDTTIERPTPSYGTRRAKRRKLMQDNSGFPESYRDMVETALILHSRLRSSPSLQRYTPKPLLNDVVRRILDWAGYWGPSAMWVDVMTSIPGPPKLTLLLKAGWVRKIELFLAAPYRGSTSRNAQESRVVGVTSASYHGNRSRRYIRMHYDHDLYASWRHGQRARNQIVFDEDPELLRWVETTEENEGIAMPLGQKAARVPPPRILGDERLWDSQGIGFELDIWKQTWPMANTKSGKYEELSRRTKEWMENLKEGDTITLTTAEGFSIQDVAKFFKFGVVVYSVI